MFAVLQAMGAICGYNMIDFDFSKRWRAQGYMSYRGFDDANVYGISR